MADEVKEERALPGGWSAAKEPRAAKSAEGVRKEAPTIGSLPPSKTHENVWDHLDDWTTVGDDAIRDADVGSSSGPAKSALKQRKPTSSSAKASKQRERPDDDGLPEDMLEERLIGCSAVIFGLLLWGLPTLWWLAEPQHALSRFGAAPARSQYLEFLRPLPEAVTADRFLEWECSAALSIASAGRNVSIEVYLDQKLVLGGDAGAQVMPQLTQTSRRSGAKVEPIRITFDLGDVGFGFHNATVRQFVSGRRDAIRAPYRVRVCAGQTNRSPCAPPTAPSTPSSTRRSSSSARPSKPSSTATARTAARTDASSNSSRARPPAASCPWSRPPGSRSRGALRRRATAPRGRHHAWSKVPRNRQNSRRTPRATPPRLRPAQGA